MHAYIQYACLPQLICYVLLASEFRSWALFYAVPVLNGILNDDYLHHYILFSEALWLLLQSSISQTDIDAANTYLQKFCADFAVYYGIKTHMQNCLCLY